MVIWRGTAAEYAVVAKNAHTLYLVVG